jgi:MOSC domain-containing protein YiiM
METLAIRHRTTAQLEEGLTLVRQSPPNNGVLSALVIRPAENERRMLRHVALSPEGGVHGDRWADGCSMTLPDGSPHPDVQVTLTNARFMALIAQDENRWALAGDNLYVDLDLSTENLKTGQRLAIGTALLAVTAVPHNGCKKYARRYGEDAVRFVNTPVGKSLHLRGVYAKIIRLGTVTVGDTITKV